MTPAQLRKLDRELRAYFDSMVDGMGRAERRRAMELYLTGLLPAIGGQRQGARCSCWATNRSRRRSPG